MLIQLSLSLKNYFKKIVKIGKKKKNGCNERDLNDGKGSLKYDNLSPIGISWLYLCLSIIKCLLHLKSFFYSYKLRVSKNTQVKKKVVYTHRTNKTITKKFSTFY